MLSHLIDFVLRVCQMDRWPRPSHPCAIHFENDKGEYRVGDPWMDGLDEA